MEPDEKEDVESVGNITLYTEKKRDESTDVFKNIDGSLLKKFISNKSGEVNSKQIVKEYDGYDLYDCVEPPFNIATVCKLYDASGIHASAIDAKVDNIFGLGHYYDPTEKTQKMRDKYVNDSDKLIKQDKLIRRAQSDLDNFLETLNDLDSFDETICNFLKDYFVTGNAYLEVGRDMAGKIKYLGHISPRNIRIRKRRDGFVQVVEDKAVFFRAFGKRTSDPINNDPRPNEIIHFRRYNPNSDYYGVPDVLSVDQAVAGNRFSQQYNIDYFENKAVPRFIIKLKGVKMSDAQTKKIFEFLENTTKGKSHRSIVIPIPHGDDKDVSFEPVETGKQEASFDAYVKLNTDLILSRHRVPKNRVALDSGGNLASSRDSDKIFKDSVCKPIQRLLEKKINLIISQLTDMFVFKIKEYSLTDEDQQAQIDERYLRWGVIVPDEIRAKKGLPARPDGRGDLPLDMLSIGDTKENGRREAENKTSGYRTRTRDQERANAGVDSAGAPQGRRTKGTGGNPAT